MQTNYLKYFVDIADLGSIALAASKNYISSQGVSRSLSVLETELGYKLFDRSSNKIVLNAYGNAILPTARRILESQKEMLDQLSSMALHEAESSGEAIVAYLNNVAFDAAFLGPLTSSFKESFARTRFYQCDNDQVVEGLMGDFDEEALKLGLLCLFSPDAERNEARHAEAVYVVMAILTAYRRLNRLFLHRRNAGIFLQKKNIPDFLSVS